MPIRQFLHQLLNNERVIQKLSESAPMRYMARLTAYQYHKASEIGYKLLESGNFKRFFQDWQGRLDKFKASFGEEYKKALEDNKSKDRKQSK